MLYHYGPGHRRVLRAYLRRGRGVRPSRAGGGSIATRTGPSPAYDGRVVRAEGGEVRGLAERGDPVEVAGVGPQVGVVGQVPFADAAQGVGEEVESDQGDEELHVRLGEAVAEQVAAVGEAGVEAVQGLDDAGAALLVLLLSGGPGHLVAAGG